MTMMVTESAAGQLKLIMENQNLEDVGVRVFVRSQCGCGAVHYGMGFDDAVSEDDEVMNEGGVKFLVAHSAAEGLSGATIDYVETEESQGFAINNPNVKGCGCQH